MCELAIKIPDAVLYDTKQSKEEASQTARKVMALYYYVHEKVSLGYCAEIAGMSKEAFVRYLGANNISIFHFDDEEEFVEELNNARKYSSH